MTAYQLLPGLTPEEYANLRDDIREHGVRVPIDVDENGQVLDGHHRALIASELGVDCPRRTVAGLSEQEKIAHALAVNIHRRNLTREQRAELHARLREQGMSLRDIAEHTGASPQTVMRDAATVPDGTVPDRITGHDGKSRPSSQPRQQVPTGVTRITETTKHDTYVNNETGEVVESAANPIAEAVKQVRSGPFHIAGKALESLHFVRRAITETAGGTASIIRDINDSDLDRQIVADWVSNLDATIPVLEDLRARLRRRNLRGVK